MEFVSPYILWGLLGISAPILIHFWNKQQSKIIPWAAMQFFQLQKQTVSKGIKINDIWLLLIRILAIFLLTLLLAQLYWPKSATEQAKSKATWIIDTPLIREEFKFEIENAQQKGQEIRTLSVDNEGLSLANLQDFVNQNQLFFKQNKVEAYLPQEPFLVSDVPLVVPDSVNIKWSSLQKNTLKVIHQNKWFYVGNSGNLESASLKPSGNIQILIEGPIGLQFEIENQEYKNLLLQSLKAITEVYDFNFDTTSTKKDLFIKISKNGLISIKNNITNAQIDLSENILLLTQAGALPEELFSEILKTLGLNGFIAIKNLNQIEKQILIAQSSLQASDILDKKLLILFLVIIIIERFWSLKLNK